MKYLNKMGMILVLLILYIHPLAAQSLEQLLELAYSNNPELKALQLEYESALTQAKQVNQLADPQLGIAVPILRPETRLGPQALMVNASQLFPWFGTLKAKEDIALSMAKTKYERISLSRLNLDYVIETSYYELVLIQEKQDVLEKHLSLFNGLERASLSKVENGKASIADVLTIQIKVSELRQQMEILELQKQEYYAQINDKINRKINDTIIPESTYQRIALFDYNLEEMEEKISAFHPLIQQLNWQIESSEKEQKLNSLAGKPTIGIGLDYSLVLNRTDMIPLNNGRDILIPKIMLNVPIYRKKYAAKEEEENLKQEALAYQKEAMSNSFLSRLTRLKSQYDQELINIQFKEAQLELTNAAYQILLEAYSTKTERFDELIQLQNKKLLYEIEITTALLNTYKIRAEIHRLSNF